MAERDSEGADEPQETPVRHSDMNQKWSGFSPAFTLLGRLSSLEDNKRLGNALKCYRFLVEEHKRGGKIALAPEDTFKTLRTSLKRFSQKAFAASIGMVDPDGLDPAGQLLDFKRVLVPSVGRCQQAADLLAAAADQPHEWTPELDTLNFPAAAKTFRRLYNEMQQLSGAIDEVMRGLLVTPYDDANAKAAFAGRFIERGDRAEAAILTLNALCCHIDDHNNYFGYLCDKLELEAPRKQAFLAALKTIGEATTAFTRVQTGGEKEFRDSVKDAVPEAIAIVEELEKKHLHMAEKQWNPYLDVAQLHAVPRNNDIMNTLENLKESLRECRGSELNRY